METKNIYLWLDTSQWAPGTNLQLGIGNIVFMNGPLGAFADDDAASIILNWKGDPVDVQVWTAKLGEGDVSNADDTDAYTVRVGVNVTKDLRVTVEGLVLNEMSMTGQDFGDTFWVGGTVGAKIGDDPARWAVRVRAAGVYRRRWCYLRASPAKRAGMVGSCSPGCRSGRSASTRWAGTPRATTCADRAAASREPARIRSG